MIANIPFQKVTKKVFKNSKVKVLFDNRHSHISKVVGVVGLTKAARDSILDLYEPLDFKKMDADSEYLEFDEAPKEIPVEQKRYNDCIDRVNEGWMYFTMKEWHEEDDNKALDEETKKIN